ncbi:hypothetical protein BSPWISOXPB_11085 [uncultured Gammaproteobacteria bacterium]|nr:hypothetical protein BSPWISOXPB_11085 [uncultured Gammaproteobacteria bacterium]
MEITADGDLVLKANLSSQTDINLTSHHGNITQSGDIKAVQNIDINANQTYQNEGKDTIAQANLAITANTVNNQGGQLQQVVISISSRHTKQYTKRYARHH